MISPFHLNLGRYYVAIVPFKAFVYSSYGGIVERDMQCAQSRVQLVKFVTLSDSSRLHFPMNFGSRNP